MYRAFLQYKRPNLSSLDRRIQLPDTASIHQAKLLQVLPIYLTDYLDDNYFKDTRTVRLHSRV
jgi:hypothetical protein